MRRIGTRTYQALRATSSNRKNNFKQVSNSKNCIQEKKTYSNGGYFYDNEENAFERFVNSTDDVERNLIFEEKLYPAFTKMIESIIRRYGLFTPDEDFSDTFNDAMSFLLTKVDKFDFSKGFKAYSYLGTICKNYLIMKRSKSMKQNDISSSYETLYDDDNPDMRTTESYTAQIISLNTHVIDEMKKEIRLLIDDETNTLTANEIKIGYGIVELLENWDDIFRQIEGKKFNRNSFLYFIKEYTLLSGREIRRGMRVYKELYGQVKANLIRKS